MWSFSGLKLQEYKGFKKVSEKDSGMRRIVLNWNNLTAERFSFCLIINHISIVEMGPCLGRNYEVKNLKISQFYFRNSKMSMIMTTTTQLLPIQPDGNFLYETLSIFEEFLVVIAISWVAQNWKIWPIWIYMWYVHRQRVCYAKSNKTRRIV